MKNRGFLGSEEQSFERYNEKRKVVEMNASNGLGNHPAVLAWRKINPNVGLPEGIDILKIRKKSKVFRLKGFGKDKINIIAKEGRLKNFNSELFLYKKILPHYELSSVEYHGSIESEEEGNSWMFLEDAGGMAFDQGNRLHRLAAMNWLAKLHTCSFSEEHISTLPDRGLRCYFSYLDMGRANILENINNPTLTEENIAVLKDTSAMLNKIELKWDYIKSSCAALPLSFVHGDFQPKNFVLRSNTDSGFCLIPFDWEMSGWGIPTVDLGSIEFMPSQDDLKEYWMRRSHSLSNLCFSDFLHLVKVGEVLRMLNYIYWVSRGLRFSWTPRPMKSFNFYFDSLTKLLKTLGW